MNKLSFICFSLLVVTTVSSAEPLPTWKNSIGMRFAEVPSGTFQMGSPAGEYGRTSDERRRTVHVAKPFSLAITELTQSQWQAVMGDNPSRHKGRSLPVESISWSQAVAFCQRLTIRDKRTYRLPTEVEWEWACRALQPDFSQQEIAERAWTLENTMKTMPVALRAPNSWGFFDMQGNVAEWCSDVYVNRYTGSRSQRLIKGGSCCHGLFDARPSARMGVASDERTLVLRPSFVGIRVVCEARR